MARFYATFPSLSIHFAGCYDLARFWIWPFRTYKTYILIIKSQQKYSNFVYFVNYLRISVSIGTSAKCRSYTVKLLKADILFFKTKAIYSLDMLSSFIIPPANFVCRGYTVFTLSVRASVRPSVCPSVTLCFLNNSKSHCWIFIKPCKHVHICKTNTLDKKVRARGQFY